MKKSNSKNKFWAAALTMAICLQLGGVQTFASPPKTAGSAQTEIKQEETKTDDEREIVADLAQTKIKQEETKTEIKTPTLAQLLTAKAFEIIKLSLEERKLWLGTIDYELEKLIERIREYNHDIDIGKQSVGEIQEGERAVEIGVIEDMPGDTQSFILLCRFNAKMSRKKIIRYMLAAENQVNHDNLRVEKLMGLKKSF